MSSSQLGPMSAHNPFRSPAVTPNPTGGSAASSSIPSYATLPPVSTSPAGGSSTSIPPPSYSNLSQADPYSDDEDSPEALPELTPRIPSARTSLSDRPPPIPYRNNSPYRPPSTAPPSLPPRPSSILTDPGPPSGTPPIDILPPSFSPELEAAPPPAYSIAPDVNGGELIVQQGPRRPFQPAPEPFLPFPAPQISQQELQPPQQQQQQHRFAPPPGPPPGVSSPPSERPHSQLSSFAQDFYSAGTATPPPDEPQPQRTRYAPPPGAPPPPRPRAASTSSGAGSMAPPASDGRPTTTPTPGHPLLRNGQTLVYPESYSCHKCMAPLTCPLLP
jgi:hypothetical protein